MPEGGINAESFKTGRSSFYRGFLLACDPVCAGQGEREIDVLVCAAAGAVFTNPDHVFFKAALTLAAPVPKDKLSGVVFRLKTRDKGSRKAACRTKRPFDTVGVPKPL